MSPSTMTVHELAEALAASTPDIDVRGRRAAIALYDLLSQGDPVSLADVAAQSGVAEPEVGEMIQDWNGVFRDDHGRVVGFWGLAIPEMSHRFHADGGKPMYAWCALDPFLIVPVIGRRARVESKDPFTGEPITMTVTPTGLEDLSPATSVVSFLVPHGRFGPDVIENFCHYVLNFASPESAERWASEREGIVLLPASDAFEVGRRAWSTFLGAGTAAHMPEGVG
jgi:alkylmercury lyase